MPTRASVYSAKMMLLEAVLSGSIAEFVSRDQEDKVTLVQSVVVASA